MLAKLNLLHAFRQDKKKGRLNAKVVNVYWGLFGIERSNKMYIAEYNIYFVSNV